MPLTVYHELDPTATAPTPSTFIGQVYSLFGLQNIADAAEGDTGYPQLNAETIIAADPDLIFLADTKCCGESLETVAARAGWADITAVVNGNVFAMDDDIASRWGPRVVEYIQQVADAVQQALVLPAADAALPRSDAGTASSPVVPASTLLRRAALERRAVVRHRRGRSSWPPSCSGR